MRLAFMGTPDFAVPSLNEILAAGHEITAVYTKAPQPAGRGQKFRRSPVHQCAESHGLEVRAPRSFRDIEIVEEFQALDLDIAIIVAYGLILPATILGTPKLGCFNLHASLLPRWRGAAPIHRAIMAGDTETGVQVMQMEPGLDTGPVLLSERTRIWPDDTTASLHDRLARIGAGLLPRALAALERGGAHLTPQSETPEARALADKGGALYADKISTNEARIDWTAPASRVDRQIRGLSPFPGAWFEASISGETQRVKAMMSAIDGRANASAAPGEIIMADDCLIVACGPGEDGAPGAVALVTLQRAGKKVQASAPFLLGADLRVGDRLL